MIQITLLLFATTLLSQFAPWVSASNQFSIRQATINPSSLPSACQSSCQVINTISACDDNTGCLCTSTLGSQLQQCMTCLVNDSPSVESDAQSVISSWNLACNGNLSLGVSSNSSTPSSSSPSFSSSGSSSSGPSSSTSTVGKTTTTTTHPATTSTKSSSSSGSTSATGSHSTSTSTSSSSPGTSGAASVNKLYTSSIAACVVAAIFGGAFIVAL